MSRTKRNILLVALSLIFISVSAIFAFMYLDKGVSQGKSIDFGSKSINEYYELNDALTVPNNVDILDEKGEKIEGANLVNAVVYAPDGSVNNANQEITLDQVGIYTVRYYYELDGTRHYVDHNLTVGKLKYYVSSDSSSVQYISDLEDTANSQTYKFREYYYGDNGKGNTYRVDNGVEINDALRVSLNDADTFTYNKPIKLKESGATNIVTYTNFQGVFTEPIKGSDGQPLYDLYELERYPQDYYEHTVDGNGNITWAEGTDGPNGDRKWKEGIHIPYMYKDREKVKYIIYFRLTDAYDPNNYVEVKHQFSKPDGMWDGRTGTNEYYNETYAGFNNCGFKGLQRADHPQRPNTYYNGVQYDVHTSCTSDNVRYRPNSTYQLNKDNQMVAYDGTPDWYKQGALLYSQKRCYTTIQYDAKLNNLYWCANGINTCYPTLLMHLGLADVYGGKTFKGFTSDEVYLSCYVSDLGDSRAVTDIVDIGGHNINPDDKSFELVGDNAAIKYNIDRDNPYLKVNYKTSYNDVVYAAQDCEFPIFDCVARDINLKQVSTQVYFNYVDESNKGTLIYSNGKTFTPRQHGIYTIEYTAIDTFGNKTTEIVKVLCVKTKDSQLISLGITQSDFDAVTAKAGLTVNLPAHEGKYFSLNSAVDCSIKAVYLANGYEVPIESNEFTPLYAGRWQVVYTLTDSILTKKVVFDLPVAKSDYIGVEGNPTLPKYLIEGAKYAFEDFKFFTFADDEGRTILDTDIKISYDNGVTFEEFNSGSVIKKADSAIIRYYVEGKEYDSAPIEIIDVNFGENTNNKTNPPREDDPATPEDEEYGWRIERYFKGQDIDAFTTKNGTLIKATKNSGSANFEYIKEVSASNFNLGLRVHNDDEKTPDVDESTGTNFSAFNIVLTDYYDPTIKVVINLNVVNSTTAQLVVDGKQGTTTTETYLGDFTKDFSYDNDIKAFVLGAGAESAKVFCELPFTADKVYVDFEFAGISGDAGICISKFMGRSFRTLASDNDAPKNYVSYDRGNKSYGDLFTINIPCVTDTFTPILPENVYVLVASPSYSSVMTVDGIDLSEPTVINRPYQIQLVEFGRYVITYIYEDQFGNSGEIYTNIDVVEKIPPEITFKDGTACGATINIPVGKTAILKEVIVKDNIDTNPRLTVLVTDMNLNLDIVKVNSDGLRLYNLLYKGLYRVTYRAVDATGNSNIVYYYINAQ